MIRFVTLLQYLLEELELHLITLDIERSHNQIAYGVQDPPTSL